MKRLALLAVPFLALACTDAEQATLLEPPAISADVTIQAAPSPGNFLIRVFWPDVGPTCATANEVFATGNPPTYTIPSNQGSACIVVQLTAPVPTKNGAMSYFNCQANSGTFNTSSTACETGNGRWKITTRNSLSMTQWVFSGGNFVSMGDTRGAKFEYKGRGSGVKNQEVGVIDITRANS